MVCSIVKMYYKIYHVLLLFAFTFNCEALNCRSNGGGQKEDELKTIYRNCLKKQDGKNSSQSRGYSENDWKDSKGHNQRSPWDRDGFGKDDREKDDGNSRDDGKYRDKDDMYENDRTGSYDRMGSNYNRAGMGSSYGYDRGATGSGYDRTGSGSSYDRSGGNYDRTGSSYDKMGGSYDRMGDTNERSSRNDDISGRNGMMGSRTDGIGRSQLSGREDFFTNEEIGDSMSPYNKYSSTQASRRYKREKRVGTNSGQRSQYNPNASNRPSFEDYRNDDRNNSSNSSKNGDNKACAMHCFMDNLEMTGENGMPDRYLVTHAITKDVNNEDLRDFLQESIEECFQILANENTQDKCEFSKNLLMCLSEKGRANCDDWKDDIQF